MRTIELSDDAQVCEDAHVREEVLAREDAEVREMEELRDLPYERFEAMFDAFFTQSRADYVPISELARVTQLWKDEETLSELKQFLRTDRFRSQYEVQAGGNIFRR